MNKIKLFLENFLVYGLGSIISNIIPFIMLPIITRLYPSSSYIGLNDLTQTISSFFSAIAIMGMYDAMFRLFFENESAEYKKRVCSTAFTFVLCSSFLLFAVMLLVRNVLSFAFFNDEKYSFLVIYAAFSVLLSSGNSIVAAPTRMENKRNVFLVTNTVGPIVSYSICVPLILSGHYEIALPLANAVGATLLLLSFFIMNRKYFSFACFDRGILVQLLKISVPIMPSFIVYWIFNSSDRIMLTKFCSMEQTGIYSVAAKLGMISQLIYLAFSGGWQYFAFSTMKEENQVKNNSLVCEYLGTIAFSVTLVYCCFSKFFVSVLFPKAYIEAATVSVYLFLAPLLLMLFQIAGNQFLVIKKTWPSMIILFCGAMANIAFNYLLIPILGAEGAGLGTVLGYVVTDIICFAVLVNWNLLVVSGRFYFSIFSFIVIFLYWILIKKIVVLRFVVGIVLCLFFYLYKTDVNYVISILRKKIGGKM